jgi:plastocyanin
MNRAVGHDGHDHGGYCGIPGAPACNREMPEPEPGLPTPVVTITNFRYTPGDRALPGQAGLPVQVPRGSTLTFVNADMVTMAGVRHTVTSCEWPCNGPYVANYPQPDGLFDSGKLGNYDPLDGGLIDTGNYGLSGELSPVYELDTGGMEPGLYSFYCRVHPWMRGSLEIV